MCSDTKAKIASMLRTLMQERPLQKITVQDVMNCANMKRQSFYYHFQDIYQVLEWEVNRSLFDCLPESAAVCSEDWFCTLLHLVEADRVFYRKVILAVGRNKSVQKCCIHIRPQVARLMLKNRALSNAPLADEERMAVDFVTYALGNYLIDGILGYEPLDSEENLKRMAVSCRTVTCFRPQVTISAASMRKYGESA